METFRQQAAVWATWFRTLGDPSRIVILNVLATTGRTMTVGEIVDEVGLAQSTVSHHLKILGDVGFLVVERDGTSRHWQINERCLSCFPTAAEIVMGRAPADGAPWDEPVAAAPRAGRRT